MPKYRILSFDGGGIRGVLSAVLLKRLNNIFPELIEKTNIFAGTSTGSFIALGLAYGLSPDTLVDLYVNNSKFIFTPEYPEIFRPKYNNDHLIEVLNSIFPDDLRLKDLNKNVLIPSFQVIGPNGENWGPIFYNNFEHSPYLNTRVIDAALSSSAAPLYFPSHDNHIDGGVMANNPSTASICTALDKSAGNQKLQNIRLLSVGTGLNSLKITADTTEWGAIQWVLYPEPPIPIVSILFDGVIEADELFSSQLLGKRYFRLNPSLNKSVSLDDYTEIPYLVDIAEEYDLSATVNWIKRNWF